METQQTSGTGRGTSRDRQMFVSGLIERLGLPVGAQRVFGEPVERDGVTVIPVAWASWGGGGGEGPAAVPSAGRRPALDEPGGPGPESQAGQGSEAASMAGGGGAGAMIKPAGFIEIREGQARFHRIEGAPLRLVALILAAAIAFRMVMKEVRRTVR
jgi:uncharacterized spore protein YtfJ